MPQPPAHLSPSRCYVCGGEKHPTQPGGHRFWSNRDAAAEFAALAAGRHWSPEAAYVATHRPY